MPNMAYCRFTNTLEDLQDCFDNMDDHDLSEPERKSRARLVELCKRIADNYADDIEIMAA